MTRIVFSYAIVAFFLIFSTACEQDSVPPGKKDTKTPQVQRMGIEIPPSNAYAGAYIDFGETEDDVTLEAIEAFEKMVGKHQAMVAMSSYWGKQSFPMGALKIITAYGAVPLVYWSPWDHPYNEAKGQGRFSLPRIIAGECDAYIDMWAQQARIYGEPMLVSWGLEMNGEWFPWSGVFYGGGKVIPKTNPPQYKGPELYKKAYRYVVDRVRASGVANIQWVFHANNSSNPDEKWNRMANYYPGGAYVDWLGLSAYGQQYPSPAEWIPFEAVLPAYYREICGIDPTKPFILAEWGVGEFPNSGDKAAWIKEAFSRMTVEFPRLKAAIFWHERWPNGDLSYSNLRANSSEESLAAYRQGIAIPFWLDRPRFITVEKKMQ